MFAAQADKLLGLLICSSRRLEQRIALKISATT
jgi:hypothetical protein